MQRPSIGHPSVSSSVGVWLRFAFRMPCVRSENLLVVTVVRHRLSCWSWPWNQHQQGAQKLENNYLFVDFERKRFLADLWPSSDGKVFARLPIFASKNIIYKEICSRPPDRDCSQSSRLWAEVVQQVRFPEPIIAYIHRSNYQPIHSQVIIHLSTVAVAPF